MTDLDDDGERDRAENLHQDEFPEGGWGAFASRVVAILCYLAILVIGFLAMTGLWRLF